MHEMQHMSKTHQSLEKALTLLLVFAPHNKEMGTVELSSLLGLHKSTVSRLLKVLVAHKFLIHNPETRKYSLGPAIIQLGRALNQSLRTNLVQIAKPYVDDLRYRLRETVVFEILAGENMVMAYVAEGTRLVRLAGSIGDRVPFHAAAGAKAFLAYCSPEVRDSLLGIKLRRFTKYTITNRKRLDHELEAIRRKGFAFDQEELDEGTFAIGAPIFNHENSPIAALVVAGPSQRISWSDDSPIVAELLETAEKISRRFYSGNIRQKSSGKRP
jgi:IclR family acetate operon transcriptional repressor